MDNCNCAKYKFHKRSGIEIEDQIFKLWLHPQMTQHFFEDMRNRFRNELSNFQTREHLKTVLRPGIPPISRKKLTMKHRKYSKTTHPNVKHIAITRKLSMGPEFLRFSRRKQTSKLSNTASSWKLSMELKFCSENRLKFKHVNNRKLVRIENLSSSSRRKQTAKLSNVVSTQKLIMKSDFPRFRDDNKLSNTASTR